MIVKKKEHFRNTKRSFVVLSCIAAPHKKQNKLGPKDLLFRHHVNINLFYLWPLQCLYQRGLTLIQLKSWVVLFVTWTDISTTCHFGSLHFSRKEVCIVCWQCYTLFFFGELSCNVIAWPYVVHSLLVKAKSKTRSRMVSFNNKTIQTPEALFKMINN